MGNSSGRFWLGIALIVVGAVAVFGLNAVSGTAVAGLGLVAVVLMSSGTLLAGTSGSTEGGHPV